MSHPSIHLTEAEFRAHIDAAVKRGMDAMLQTFEGFAHDLRQRTAPDHDAEETL